VRLFVALDFPDAVRDAIRNLIARLKPLCKDARWVRPEGMHVTLKFIGYVDAGKLDPIITALSKVHSDAPVEMRFRGVGFFPTERRPRVFWGGIEASPNLGELAAGIEHALEALEIEAEKREFLPHLTFARFESPKGTARLLEAAKELQSLDLGTTRETEFHLYESVLHRSGAEYTKRKSFSFVKGAT
jgi:RNA 2',3'-cyclic 3'-phosphodiesterase